MNRRDFMRLGLLAPAPIILIACGADDAASTGEAVAPAGSTVTPSETGGLSTQTTGVSGATALLTPTPACGDDDEPTIAQTEGPYFTPNSPARQSLLEAGVTGTRLIVEGAVLTTGCRTVPNALVDFWQCDAAGNYDNAGYRLRGHQLTDANGRYRLETIVPGIYTGRTRHIHVKVQAPNWPVLTTQLYFPGEPANQRDGIYAAALELSGYRDAADGKTGGFNFVLDIA